MAGAAAKKAALAKQETAQIYLPLLIGVNIIYVFLMIGTSPSIPYNGTKFGIFGMIITWLQQAYSYVGILDSSANQASKSKNSKDLAGGANLDLLGATIFVQFLSVLHTPKWFYLTLFGVPTIAIYKLFITFYGRSNTNNNNKSLSSRSNNNDGSNKDNKDDLMTEKRQRRAEKRRQKWS